MHASVFLPGHPAVRAGSTIELIKRDQPRSVRFPLPGPIQQQLLALKNMTFQVNKRDYVIIACLPSRTVLVS
jgi:hypothetical protein